MVALTRPYDGLGVLAPEGLATLEDLHRTLDALPSVKRVSSLVNAPVLVSSPGAPAGSPVWIPPSRDAGRKLFDRLKASRFERFVLLSALWDLTPIYLESEASVSDAHLVNAVQAAISEVRARHPEGGTVLVIGPAVVDSGLSSHVFDDLRRLVPVAVLVVVLGLLLTTRSVFAVLLAVGHSGALLAAVLGGMAVSGASLNLVSVLAPVLVVPLGVADLLHLVVRLRSTRATSDSHGPATVERAFEALERPMVSTSVTTALGFLGFLLSPVGAIRQFGIVMAFGAMVALALTLTLDAALLAWLWKPARSRRRSRRSVSGIWLALVRDPSRLRRSSRTIAIGCAVVAVLGLLGVEKITIEDTWIRNFDPASRVRRDVAQFEEVFLGTNLLSVVVAADLSRPGARDRAVDLVHDLSEEYAFAPGIRGALSATIVARAFDPDQPWPWESWPAPPPARVERSLEDWSQRGLALPRVATLANPERSLFQVLLFVHNQPYAALSDLVDAVAARALERSGDGVTATVGGPLAANVRMVRQAVVAQGFSMGALFVVLTAVCVALTRSWRSGILLTLPMGLAIVATYGVLTLAEIPYGLAVSMFPTLVVGLAIDFALHTRAALARAHGAPARRVARELTLVARGILLNGALWTVGFGVLALSSLPPNRYLGLLCATVVALSTLATLALVPAFVLDARRLDHVRG